MMNRAVGQNDTANSTPTASGNTAVERRKAAFKEFNSAK